MSDIVSGESGREPSRRERRSVGSGAFYKPGQGYYTRLGTAIGAGILIIAGGKFIHGALAGSPWLDPGGAYYLPVLYGSVMAFLLIMGSVVYWLVGLSHGANDFFIATEGEMKKVSWSSRKEVIRSTKVVIFTVIVMASVLFVADVVFLFIMHSIGVIRTGVSVLEAIGLGR